MSSNWASFDFYYAADASDPDWTYIGSAENFVYPYPSELMMSYTLPSGATNQAVRVQLRHNGLSSDNPCGTSNTPWDESKILYFACPFAINSRPLALIYNGFRVLSGDDLVFKVMMPTLYYGGTFDAK